MKIRTDVNEILPGRATLSADMRAPQIQSQLKTLPEKPVNSAIAAQLNIETGLGDALTIAQASHNILQKAMVITSQLRSIAAEAMHTGRVNTQNLSQAMSEIKNTLGDTGAPVQIPVSRFSGHASARVPSIQAEMNQFHTLAAQMTAGQNPGPAPLETLYGSMQAKSRQLSSLETTLNNSLSKLGINVEADTANIGRLAARTMNLITSSPDNALRAQGNVPREILGRIAGS